MSLWWQPIKDGNETYRDATYTTRTRRVNPWRTRKTRRTFCLRRVFASASFFAAAISDSAKGDKLSDLREGSSTYGSIAVKSVVEKIVCFGERAPYIMTKDPQLGSGPDTRGLQHREQKVNEFAKKGSNCAASKLVVWLWREGGHMPHDVEIDLVHLA